MANTMERKYGIWLLPYDESGKKLQNLINNLADDLGSVKFIPHVSIAGVTVKDQELSSVKAKMNMIAKAFDKFTITLNEYGIKNEKHRSLYLVAKSPELDNLFEYTSSLLPDAQIDRNRKLPHMSVVYGNYSEKAKKDVIYKHPINISFEVRRLDLCLTEGNEADWHSIYSTELM